MNYEYGVFVETQCIALHLYDSHNRNITIKTNNKK